MYTGMNFLPLCTAIVCPTISGRIVERRDHVFTTFFSFRAFNASTFTRSGSSTNGPFFSERGIFFLFLHPAQLHPLRPAHFPEASHRTWNTVRDRAERTHKPSPLRIRYLFNDHGPTSLAQAKQCLGCGRKLRCDFRGGLYCRLRPAPRRCFPRARGSPCCTPRCSCGCHKVALCSPPRRIHFCFYSSFYSLLYSSLLPQTPLRSPLHNHPVALALLSRLRAQSWKAPGSLRVVALHTALAAAVRMVHRVHRYAAHRWTLAVPARAARFSVRNILVIEVPELADRGHAINAESPHFTRSHLHQGELAFLAQKLRRPARCANHLPALAGKELEIVNHRSRRDMAEPQRVARKNVRALAVLHRHAHLEPHRMQDVAFLSIRVMQQRNPRRTIGIVFDGCDLRRDADFLAAKID